MVRPGEFPGIRIRIVSIPGPSIFRKAVSYSRVVNVVTDLCVILWRSQDIPPAWPSCPPHARAVPMGPGFKGVRGHNR